MLLLLGNHISKFELDLETDFEGFVNLLMFQIHVIILMAHFSQQSYLPLNMFLLEVFNHPQ